MLFHRTPNDLEEVTSKIPTNLNVDYNSKDFFSQTEISDKIKKIFWRDSTLFQKCLLVSCFFSVIVVILLIVASILVYKWIIYILCYKNNLKKLFI